MKVEEALRQSQTGLLGISLELVRSWTLSSWLWLVELRNSDSHFQGPVLHGHPFAEARPGGLGLPSDPSGVPWVAELHGTCQAQGETMRPQEMGAGLCKEAGEGPCRGL